MTELVTYLVKGVFKFLGLENLNFCNSGVKKQPNKTVKQNLFRINFKIVPNSKKWLSSFNQKIKVVLY